MWVTDFETKPRNFIATLPHAARVTRNTNSSQGNSVQARKTNKPDSIMEKLFKILFHDSYPLIINYYYLIIILCYFIKFYLLLKLLFSLENFNNFFNNIIIYLIPPHTTTV